MTIIYFCPQSTLSLLYTTYRLNPGDDQCQHSVTAQSQINYSPGMHNRRLLWHMSLCDVWWANIDSAVHVCVCLSNDGEQWNYNNFGNMVGCKWDVTIFQPLSFVTGWIICTGQSLNNSLWKYNQSQDGCLFYDLHYPHPCNNISFRCGF